MIGTIESQLILQCDFTEIFAYSHVITINIQKKVTSGKIWPLCEICISGASPVGRRRFLAPLIPKIDVPLILLEVQGLCLK